MLRSYFPMNSPRHLLSACAALALTAVMAGCASVGAPLPPSLELPKPPSDLRAFRKGDKVYLSWTAPTFTMDRQTLRHRGPTRICRSLQVAMSDCTAPTAVLPLQAAPPNGHSAVPEPQPSYVDTLPPDLAQQNPTRMITYAVEALNDSGRGAGLSNQVQVPLAPTVSPPADFRAQTTAGGVVLTWTGELRAIPMSPINHFYRVYRRLEGTQEKTVVGEVPRGFEQYPSAVDQTFAWEKNYEYWVTVVTDIQVATTHPCPVPETPSSPTCFDHVQVEGEDSAVVNVFTHDVFPPAVPSGVQAVFSGPGQATFIDLLWAPDADADLAGYNVYRRESQGAAQRINSDLVKTPAYRDTQVSPGKTYYYSVAAVDLRGNESNRSDEATETVP